MYIYIYKCKDSLSIGLSMCLWPVCLMGSNQQTAEKGTWDRHATAIHHQPGDPGVGWTPMYLWQQPRLHRLHSPVAANPPVLSISAPRKSQNQRHSARFNGELHTFPAPSFGFWRFFALPFPLSLPEAAKVFVKQPILSNFVHLCHRLEVTPKKTTACRSPKATYTPKCI